MAHQHLILAYLVTWGIQLTYAACLGWKWRAVRQAERQDGMRPNHPPTPRKWYGEPPSPAR